MENKYYTPNIEDIRIGYEMEWLHKANENSFILDGVEIDTWFPWDYDSQGFSIKAFKRFIENNTIRTPYLTDQQIVNEGWEPKEVFGDYVCIYQKVTKEKGFELVYNFEKHTLMFRKLYFYGLDEEYTNTKLSHDSLECKSINELRDLEKLFKTK